ncbi:MAG: hypothetical protein ACOYKN_20410, partial [Pirellula sp.]
RKQLEKLIILASENPPSAADVEGWLVEHTPDRQRYAEARARYREAKEQASKPHALKPQETPDSPETH